MHLILLKLAIYACIWFAMMASMGGLAGIFIITALKHSAYNSKLILNSVFVGYWCGIVAIYYAFFLYRVSLTPPYDALPKIYTVLIASVPFLIAFLLAYWILRNLRIGW